MTQTIPTIGQVVFDDKEKKWHAVLNDGTVVHRSTTKEGAEKTLDRMSKLAMEEQIPVDVKPATMPVKTSEIKFQNLTNPPFDFTAATALGLEVRNLVPKVDPNYVPFGNYDDVEQIILNSLFYPAFISGPTGNGKSTMVEQICAKLNRPLIRVNLNMMVDEEILIGSKTLTNGNVEIIEGPLIIAMRTGATILLDEIDAGAPNTLLCLQPILEGKPYYFKLKNEIIIPAPGFNIIATANTKGKGSDDGKYIGTNVLNEAFLERFAVTFNQEYPNITIEETIIRKLMSSMGVTDDPFAETLAKWADSIRKTNEAGGADETMTTRRVGHIIRSYAIYRDRRKAVELCCNRFDHTTKTAFLDTFDKMCPPLPGKGPKANPFGKGVKPDFTNPKAF